MPTLAVFWIPIKLIDSLDAVSLHFSMLLSVILIVMPAITTPVAALSMPITSPLVAENCNVIIFSLMVDIVVIPKGAVENDLTIPLAPFSDPPEVISLLTSVLLDIVSLIWFVD